MIAFDPLDAGVGAPALKSTVPQTSPGGVGPPAWPKAQSRPNCTLRVAALAGHDGAVAGLLVSTTGVTPRWYVADEGADALAPLQVIALITVPFCETSGIGVTAWDVPVAQPPAPLQVAEPLTP